MQVIVYGPPIVGKSTLSKLISEAYGLIYISPETVAQDILDDLVSLSNTPWIKRGESEPQIKFFQ